MRTVQKRLRARRPGAKRLGLLAVLALLVSGCTSAPPGITPIENFDLKTYLGTWYEIARLDHSFERGLSDVRADYALRPGSRAALAGTLMRVVACLRDEEVRCAADDDQAGGCSSLSRMTHSPSPSAPSMRSRGCSSSLD